MGQPLDPVPVEFMNWRETTRYILTSNGYVPNKSEDNALQRELSAKACRAAFLGENYLQLDSWKVCAHGIEVRLSTPIDAQILENELRGKYLVLTGEELLKLSCSVKKQQHPSAS